MSTDSPVTHLTRDVEAIQIPSGLTKKLTKGMPVIITQALGGTYTIVVEHSAGLFRVLAADADALGKVHIHDEPSRNGTGKTDGPAQRGRNLGAAQDLLRSRKSRSTSSISASSTASRSSRRKAEAIWSK